MAARTADRWMAAALAGALLLAVPGASQGAPEGPTPLATVVPFPLPLLEGAKAKVEIGHGGPDGDATSFWGNAPALVNFSVWWWDTGPPSSARLFIDGAQYAVAPAPSGDGDDTNGTLFVVKVNTTTLVAGDHEYYFDFTGPSGSVRLPASENFTNLRLDVADRFLSDNLRTIASQIVNAKRAGTITTLREVANRTLFTLDTVMATHWDGASGYTYADRNHYIIQPSGATADDREAFVTSSGASRARYTDSASFLNNSQPAIKQALALRGVLLSTGFFNESEIELVTETMVVNNTTYPHPFLRLALSDGSEAAGDGPVDGDGQMDLDLWAAGLASPVPAGSHFGEDFNAANDAPWDGGIGWPPVPDTYAAYVLAPYRDAFNVTAPDGSSLVFYLFESRVNAGITTPRLYNNYFTDDPVVFDGLSSNQTASVDLAYEWVVESTVWTGFGAVWLQPLGAVGTYSGTLTVRDPFGQIDSVTVTFYMHGKTKLRNPVSDLQFLEDSTGRLDLNVFFSDDDGFATINFSFSSNPPGAFSIVRFPATGGLVNFSAAPDWCGVGDGYINATDGMSPPVSQHFNITVACVNDAPVLSGLPTAVNFSEDGVYAYAGLSAHGTDADVGDTLAWSFGGTVYVAGSYFPANDTLVLTAPANWSGLDAGMISVTDGSITVNHTVAITVLRANDAPLQTDIVPDFSVDEDSANTTFQLLDYFEDPDGDTLSAQLTAGPGLEAGYFTVLRQVWFHPVANFSGATSFTLRVGDPSNASLTVVVNVIVREVNDPPLIISVEPSGYASADEGDLLTFLVTAVDSDTSTLTYAFELDGEPQGSSFLGSFDWQTGFLSAGRHDLNLTVTDGEGGSAAYHWSVLVLDRNRGPSVTIAQAGAATHKTGETILLSADGTDPDGDNLTYTWTFGGALQPAYGREVEVRINSEGNYTVKVTVSDGKLTASDTAVLRIVYEPPVEPPNNNSAPPPTTQPGFLPGIEGAALFAALAVAAALLAARHRRRR